MARIKNAVVKICLAQIQSTKGDIRQNIENHIHWINRAIECESSLIVFPELSLTGYEPSIAKSLAINLDDQRLTKFQEISNENNITIVIGAPVKIDQAINIGLIIFQPYISRVIYSKQILHEDERLYFTPGQKQVIINLKNHRIAFGICFESIQPKHLRHAINLGTDIYIAVVAKSQEGIIKAYNYFPKSAKQYSIPILLCNSIGANDNFICVGLSSVWNKNGELVGHLTQNGEKLLVFDTNNGQVEDS